MWTRLLVSMAVGVMPGCEAPCTPDLHPAVVVHLPDRACDSVVVLLGQTHRPTLLCADLFADRAGCVAWCGRADWQGPALVRVQAGERTIDTPVELPAQACPDGPSVEIEIAPPVSD